MMFSTSSPTYPASVSVVASAMVKGTSRMRARVCANSVLPEPVGPISRMFDFAIAGQKLGVDFIDINMINIFKDQKINWVDGMTPMMEARAVKNVDEQECMRIVGAIGD